MTSIVYRKLAAPDVAIYRATRLACLKNHPESFGSTYEEESANPKLPFEADLESGEVNRFIVGAFDGERLVGIAGFIRSQRRKTRHRGDIVQMYVDAEFRGRDVGEKLLRTVIEMAFAMEGLDQIELGVSSMNAGATRLYEKIGFQSFALHPRYFRDRGEYTDQRQMQLTRERYVP